MPELRTIPGPATRTGPRIAVCIVTRSGRERYLKKTLGILRKQPVDILVWANGEIDHSLVSGLRYFRQHPFNVGQHVAHNEMLDECMNGSYDWHIRVDDDCWMTTRRWLPRLLKIAEKFKATYGKYPVLSPFIRGLNDPPVAIERLEMGRDILSHVQILGGIFRMSPMGLMRYFRWDERQAMGFGDAMQFASYCDSVGVPLIRVDTIECTHGESTEAQKNADADWDYEHDMLQYVPLGL